MHSQFADSRYRKLAASSLSGPGAGGHAGLVLGVGHHFDGHAQREQVVVEPGLEVAAVQARGARRNNVTVLVPDDVAVLGTAAGLGGRAQHHLLDHGSSHGTELRVLDETIEDGGGFGMAVDAYLARGAVGVV